MMFKILLIHANSTLDTLIPPNLAVMSACLKNAGIGVKLFDTTFYKTREITGDDARVNTLQVKETPFEDIGIYLNKTDMYEDFIKMVEEYQPNLVGLSAVSLTYPFGIKFLERLKEKFEIPTVVGGIHATISSEDVLENPYVDYVCVGEGEQALVELCEAIRDGKDTTNIKNIWTKKNDKIIKNPLRPLSNMDELPFHDWEIFDKRRVYKPMGGKIRRVGCFELNRGCPFNCSYCCNQFLHNMYGLNYRERSVKKFIAEVKYMKNRYNLEYIYISAESFLSTKRERFLEFIKEWKAHINLPFWCETRPEAVTEEKARLLEGARCASVSVGLESGDLDIRKMLNRLMTDEQIINAFKYLKKTKMRISTNVIIGFPDETREQIFRTIELCRRISVDNLMVHVFNPYKGTSLYDYCIKKKYISPDIIGGDYRIDTFLKMPQISTDEIRGLQRTFALYVRLPKDRWSEISIAEKFDEEGNRKFEELKEEYTKRWLK